MAPYTITFVLALLFKGTLFASDIRLIDPKDAETIIGKSIDNLESNGVKLQRLKWHAFKGATIFGSETLQVYQIKRKDNTTCREIVLIRNEKIVSLESRYESSAIKLKEQILKPALTHYGTKNCSKHFYRSNNIDVRGWLLKGKKTTSVISTGSFKDELAPGWIKVRHFDTKFFHYRNQHEFWPNDYGQVRLILR